MPRQPRGQFLSRSGLRSTPMRRLPEAADESEVVDRIREARALQDEPEVITDRAILRDWEEVALLHHSKQHAEDVAAMKEKRPELEPEDRLRDLKRRARHAKVDLSRETWTMDVEIKRARTGNRHVPGRVLRRMEALENLLDGLS